MNIIQRASFATTAIAFTAFIGTGSALAQTPQPPPAPTPQERTQPAPAEASMIEGELLRVDAETKTIVVKTADADVQLRYTEETKVTGGASSVAGLSNTEATKVSVQFTGQGMDRVATEIVIHPRQ